MKVTLDNFLREINEKTTENDQYPVLTSSKVGLFLQSDYFNKQVASKDNIGYKIIHRGQFTYRAMSDTGEFFPNMLECTDIGIVSPAYPVFEITKPDIILPEYLKYFFKSDSFQHSISSFAQGSTRTSVKFGKMKTVSINLPSLEEQNRIIDILNKAKSIVACYENEIEKLDELIKARFVEMFGSKTQHKHVKLNDVCSLITDGTHQPPKFEQSGVPFLFVSNIKDNVITYDTEKFISEETYQELIKRTPIEIGDVLLSTVGSYGHPAVVKENRRFCFQRHIAYLKPKQDIVDSVYLHGAILSDDVQNQIDRMVRGIAQKTLNLSSIREISIPLPELSKQKVYSSIVGQTNKSKVVVQKALDEAQLLFDSLMQKYFG